MKGSQGVVQEKEGEEAGKNSREEDVHNTRGDTVRNKMETWSE